MVAAVPVERIADYWPRVEKMLEAAYRRGGMYSAADARAECEAGRWVLWLAVRPKHIVAAACSEFQSYPQRNVLFVHLAGGEGEGIAAMWPEVRKHAALMGCKDMIFIGRRGWARSPFVPKTWRHLHDVVAVPVEG